MTLSAFLKTIKKYCAGEATIPNFMRDFFNAVTTDSSGDDLFADDSKATKIFNGTHKFNKTAKIISGKVDVIGLKEFIELDSVDSADSLKSEFGADFYSSDDFGEAIVQQFMLFIKNPDTKVKNIIVCKNANLKNVSQISSLYQDDDFEVTDSANTFVKYGFYEKFSFTWSDRVLVPVQLSSLKTSTPKGRYTVVETGEKTLLTIELDTRGDERNSPYKILWEIRDSKGQVCFPNKDHLKLTVEIESTHL